MFISIILYIFVPLNLTLIQNMDTIELLVKLEYLKPREVLSYDSACGEPVTWGHIINDYIPEKEKKEISKVATFGRLPWPHAHTFTVITKRLTHEEAIKKYGKVTELVRGPKGAFKRIVYGKTMFLSKLEGIPDKIEI